LGQAEDVALRDYEAWHDAYERPGSRLHLRLLVVQDLIARALDELPAGPLRAISVCAGQGRDIVTVVRRHRRGPDVSGRLVEILPANVVDARRRIAAAGVDGLEVVEADAGVSDAYAGAVPAHLVLACGVFGNIPRDDIAATIAFLPRLCAPGARVIWTRRPAGDGTIVPAIESWLSGAGFTGQSLVVPDDGSYAVGAARLDADPQPFAPGQHLFRFTR
jgi:hypothetical protein